MKGDIDVYVIGCTSSFYQKEGGYGVKTEGVKQYLEFLDKEFEVINFFSALGGSDISESVLVDIDPERLHTQSVSDPVSFLSDLVWNSYSIFTSSSSGSTVSIVYLPSMFSFLISIPLLYKSDRIILYYMSDTNKVIWGTDSAITKVKDVLYNRLDNLLVKNCDYILYRDESVVDRRGNHGPDSSRSKPLIAMDGQDIFVRDNTCTSEPIQLVFVGSLIPRKGIQYLLESLANLNKQTNSTEFELILVGDGHERDTLIKRSEELGIDESVEFKGHITDSETLMSIYRESDIFVLPSLEEGFPRVVIEAMSQSLPVVTTSVGEIPDRLDGSEAIQVSPKSVEELTEAIETIVTNPKRRKNLIASGRQKAEDVLTSSAGEQHSSIIRSLVTRTI
ncbi:glycosyltransferase [Haloferacaceae archaeon DSL9]